MAFCRLLKTEPYIAVNSGLGDVKAAAEEVQYANGAADTPMGKLLRHKNGHPQPYGVKFWSIGNEMYGNWQLGHMPLEKYVEKHNQFAEAMREDRPVDQAGRRRRRGAVERDHAQPLCRPNGPDQRALLLRQHRRTWRPTSGRSPTPSAADRRGPSRVTAARSPALAGKDIRIALDEWNYWYGRRPFRRAGHPLLSQRRLGDRRRPERVRPAKRHRASWPTTPRRSTSSAASRPARPPPRWRPRAWCWRSTAATSARCRWPPRRPSRWTWPPPGRADRKTLTLAVVNPTLASGVDLLGSSRASSLRGTGKPLADRRPRPDGLQRAWQAAKVSIEETPVEKVPGLRSPRASRRWSGVDRENARREVPGNACTGPVQHHPLVAGGGVRIGYSSQPLRYSR